MKKELLYPILATSIIFLFALAFHYYEVFPHNWKGFFMWIPLYISPVWGIAGISHLSERGKKE